MSLSPTVVVPCGVRELKSDERGLYLIHLLPPHRANHIAAGSLDHANGCLGEIADGEVAELAGDLVGGERKDPELGGGGERGEEGAVEEVGGEVEVAEVKWEEEVGGEGAEEAGARQMNSLSEELPQLAKQHEEEGEEVLEASGSRGGPLPTHPSTSLGARGFPSWEARRIREGS